MSPQLTIITAAMSLGGMASVGFNHFGEVEKQVLAHQTNQEEQIKKVEVAEVGDRVESNLAEMEESLRLELKRDRSEFARLLAELNADVDSMKQKQSAQEVLLEVLEKEQSTLGFKIEVQAKSFRPLRATGSRFVPIKSASEPHPLLPPVESSWTEDY